MKNKIQVYVLELIKAKTKLGKLKLVSSLPEEILEQILDKCPFKSGTEDQFTDFVVDYIYKTIENEPN